MRKASGILIGGDLLIALLITQIGLLIHTGSFVLTGSGPEFSMELLRVGTFIAVLLFTSNLAELYAGEWQTRGRRAGVRTFISSSIAFVLLSLLYALVPAIRIENVILIPCLVAFAVIQAVWHYRFPFLLRAPGIAQRVLVLGAGPLARQMAALMDSENENFVFAGYVDVEGDLRTVPKADIVGSFENLIRVVKEKRIDKLVISLTERRGILPVLDVLKCKLSGVEVLDAMTFYERISGRLMVENIHPSWFIFSDGFRLTPFMCSVKRLVDIVLAAAGLVIVSPFLPFIALAIRLDSPGPVFFRQYRVGKGEELFEILKFRTMRPNAEERTGAVWARPNDDRVTRLGRFLRKTRLDEIPQLFNVLKGEMSFVGPRPERPEFVERLKEKIPYYGNRHCVKPGVTGWAQIRFPYGASDHDALEKLRYDLYYIKNCSLFLDFIILVGTVKVVLGAFYRR